MICGHGRNQHYNLWLIPKILRGGECPGKVVTFVEETGLEEIAKKKLESAPESPPMGLLAIELEKGYGEDLKEHHIKSLDTGVETDVSNTSSILDLRP